jgi:acetyl-CoA C-acetyltransferase
MRKVAIVGAGMTAFGEHFALGIEDLLPMAFARHPRRKLLRHRQ